MPLEAAAHLEGVEATRSIEDQGPSWRGREALRFRMEARRLEAAGREPQMAYRALGMKA